MKWFGNRVAGFWRFTHPHTLKEASKFSLAFCPRSYAIFELIIRFVPWRSSIDIHRLTVSFWIV